MIQTRNSAPAPRGPQPVRWGASLAGSIVLFGAMLSRAMLAPVALLALAGFLMLGTAAPAGAMPSDQEEAAPAARAVDPAFAEGRAAIERQDWQAAITALTDYVRRVPKSADAFNYLGFAQRNLGDYDAAFTAYGRALEIDPEHRGAHEYVGEAYLKVGNLAKAEEHLDQLDRLCLFGCAEYSALKDAVVAYKAGRGS